MHWKYARNFDNSHADLCHALPVRVFMDVSNGLVCNLIVVLDPCQWEYSSSQAKVETKQNLATLASLWQCFSN